MDTENYGIGLRKVLFKAGILGSLQEPRDAVTVKLLQSLKRPNWRLRLNWRRIGWQKRPLISWLLRVRKNQVKKRWKCSG